jgi:hypothetical protein
MILIAGYLLGLGCRTRRGQRHDNVDVIPKPDSRRHNNPATSLARYALSRKHRARPVRPTCGAMATPDAPMEPANSPAYRRSDIQP